MTGADYGSQSEISGTNTGMAKKIDSLEFQIVQDLTTVHTAYLMLQSLQDRAATVKMENIISLEDNGYSKY